MGQKINPQSFRLPISKNWRSKWFSKREYAKNILEDLQIRKAVFKKHNKSAAISSIEILRDHEKITVNIYTAKPGILIGRSGQGINDLKNFILKNVPYYKVLNSKDLPKLKLEIIEVKNFETKAQLISENIALQLEKRIPYKRAVKQAIMKATEKGVKGVKIQVSGRLGGSEIARSEKYGENSIPLGKLRAEIDYGYATAFTTYGTVGIKTWIYTGDKIIEEKK